MKLEIFFKIKNKINVNDFVFDYDNCDDIKKLKNHIRELMEFILGLIEES